MNPWIAVLRALPTTFAIFAGTALLAAIQAWPTAFELSGIHVSLLDNSTVGIAGVESLIALLPTFRAQAMAFLLAALVYASLSPWLQMAWLSALAEPKGPFRALSDGARLAPRACLTTLCVALGSLLLLAPWVALAWWIHGWLAARSHVRVQDLATLLALLPCLPVVMLAFAWHDLARARALSRGGVRSALSSFKDALRPVTFARFTLWAALGWSMVIAAQILAFIYPARGSMPTLLTIAAVQGAALSRNILRSRWLTETLLYVDDCPARGARGHREFR